MCMENKKEIMCRFNIKKDDLIESIKDIDELIITWKNLRNDSDITWEDIDMETYPSSKPIIERNKSIVEENIEMLVGLKESLEGVL